MIVKGHPADAAVAGQIADRNLIQRLLEEEFFQGVFQCVLCQVLHKQSGFYSTVTDFAKFLGLSTSSPRATEI